MKKLLKIFGLLLGLLFLSAACAHRPSLNVGADAAVFANSVKKIWDAKMRGDWEVVYANTVSAYRNEMTKSNFMKHPKIDVKQYTIKETKIIESEKRAVSVVEYTVTHSGFEFQIPRHQEEWLWEDGTWRLNLSPDFKMPGAEHNE